MKRSEALASAATLMYTTRRGGLALSAMIILVVSVFAFLFASDASEVVTAEDFLRNAAWHRVSSWLRSCIGSASTMRLLSRGIGCVAAGVSAAVCYTVVCHFLFFMMKTLRMVEYYRIRYRLLCWTVCVIMSMSLSRAFVNAFVPFTLNALVVILVFVSLGAVIRFLRTNHPTYLIADYFLMGFLSAFSVAGVVVLLASTFVLFIAKIYYARFANMKWIVGCGDSHASVYGAYGRYGGYDDYYGCCPRGAEGKKEPLDEVDLIVGEAMTERLRLSVIMFFFLGFVVFSVLLVVCGKALGLSVNSILLDWIGWYAAELKGFMSVNALATSCVLAIAVIFASYRYNQMLDEERWLRTRDVFRIAGAAVLAFAVLAGIGQAVPETCGMSRDTGSLVSLAMQGLSCVVILMSVVVFLVNLKCRRVRLAKGSGDGVAEVRQYGRMVVALLLFFDGVPWLLLAFATSYAWRMFL